ncbi:unnamed protein product [Amoebophrya sp. A120]|nr:unnamed protein product [Amoebophrya sp. A120]|eukprot:GSA120T00025049001.1
MRSYAASGLVALIPFYQKCFVPTFGPDAGREELACCSEEKRQFPKLALNNAFGYREVHLRQPIVERAERLMTRFDDDVEKFPCALRSRIEVLPALLSAYDKGMEVLQKLVAEIVRHICYAIGSVEEPLVSPFLEVLEEMSDLLRQREDLNCPVDEAIYLNEVEVVHAGRGGQHAGSTSGDEDNEDGQNNPRPPTIQNLLYTVPLEPNLHSIQTIDQLPLPKNWTWGSNHKIWEEVKNEDPRSVNSSDVMNYERYGMNDNTFLLDFVEIQAVKLSTALSVLHLELQQIESSFEITSGEEGSSDGGADAGDDVDFEAVVAEGVPELSAIRPPQEKVEAQHEIPGRVVVFPTESTLDELSPNKIAQIVQETIIEVTRPSAARGPAVEMEADSEIEDTASNETASAALISEDGETEASASTEFAGAAVAAKTLQPVTFIEYARRKQYTRQGPDLCGTFFDHDLINNLKPNTTVSCRWLRYPEASDLPNLHFDQGVSSIGLRTSEETKLFAGLSHRQRSTDLFKQIMADYIQQHRKWRSGQPSNLKGAIVAACYGLPMCGGHGDRLHGILSLFLLAVATHRGFLIDIRHPRPLLEVLLPSFLDWRVRIEDLPLNNRVQLVDLSEHQVDRTLRGLRVSPEVLVIGTNLRFHALIHDWLQEDYGFFAFTSGWVAQVWNILFKPHAKVLYPLSKFGAKKSFLGLHFRAGNETLHSFKDPPRHGLTTITSFLECAVQVEDKLVQAEILESSTPWYFSADSEQFWVTEEVQALVQAGKVASFVENEFVAVADSSSGSSATSPTRNTGSSTSTAAIQHVDRTAGMSQAGYHRAWTEYIGLSRATALIISNSFFGETAAEIGNVPFVYYGEGCMPVHI